MSEQKNKSSFLDTIIAMAVIAGILMLFWHFEPSFRHSVRQIVVWVKIAFFAGVGLTVLYLLSSLFGGSSSSNANSKEK